MEKKKQGVVRSGRVRSDRRMLVGFVSFMMKRMIKLRVKKFVCMVVLQ